MAGKNGKRRHITGYLLVLGVVLVLCGGLSYKRILLEKEQDKVFAKYEAATREYEDEEERAKDLSELSIYTKTKKFIEDIAREKFGLVYDNEVILKPEEEE
ncbi:MAG: septum formation initiator family protein [Lachnospiraceae bacterium]|jgi:cell division protein FtsB|nr:septum formation initiator family protein [Lachnospiraceae bacterium]